jgi:hypothetical protein
MSAVNCRIAGAHLSGEISIKSYFPDSLMQLVAIQTDRLHVLLSYVNFFTVSWVWFHFPIPSVITYLAGTLSAAPTLYVSKLKNACVSTITLML